MNGETELVSLEFKSHHEEMALAWFSVVKSRFYPF
jgi:hypothetical protein